MAYSNSSVKIHNVEGSGYPGKPAIYTKVDISDIWREGDYLKCYVSASLNASGSGYFGYSITVYTQLDDGPLVELYNKPNYPARWESDVYKGGSTLSAYSTSSSARVSIWFKSNCGGECWSRNNAYKMWEVSLGAPAPATPVITASNAGYGSNYISWSASSDIDCTEWRYALDSDPWVLYKTGASTWAPGTLSVSPAVHTVTIYGKRASGQEGASPQLTWDCRIPSLSNVSLKVTGPTSGILSFYTNLDVDYYFNGTYYGRGSGNISVSVSLSSETLKDYSLEVRRTSNSNITNSTTVKGDTRSPIINLTASVAGLEVSFTTSSPVTCKDWKLVYSGGDDSDTLVSGQETSSWISSFSAKNPGSPYTLTAYGTSTVNGVTGKSNTITVTPTGCARVFIDKDNSRATAVFIYTGGRWQTAVPYIYYNGKWNMAK